MKDKLAKFGKKAFEVVEDAFDNDVLVTVVGAAIAVCCVNYVYVRGVKDSAQMVGAMLEVGKKIDEE